MVDRSFVDENDAARVELSEFIAGLDEPSFKFPVGLAGRYQPVFAI
jgi:hypothetical protein